MEVTQIADELYALHPNEFTAARDAWVAQARNAGDKALAGELAKLKRPTVGAWLVNVIALRRPEALAALFEVAAAMREADGAAELRELSARRRREIDAAIAAARDLAAAAPAGAPTPQQLGELESTLTAAMADAEAAELVRSGRMLKSLTYGGFGGFGDLGGAFVAAGAGAAPARAEARDPTAAPSRPGRAPASGSGERDGAGERGTARDAEAAAAAARDSVRAVAQRRLDEATQAHNAARAAEQAAAQRVAELGIEVERVRQRLEEADRAARVARQARVAAERELAVAHRRRDRTP